MNREERDFPRFLASLLTDLYRTILTDRNVFLLAVAGGLLGSRRRAQRGYGGALALYVAFRRLDAYMDAAIQLTHLRHLNNQQTPAHIHE